MNKNKFIFNKDDYQSDNGFQPFIWGPPLWFSLHMMSFNYPINPSKEQKKYYYDYFKSLSNVLPCGECRENYKEHLKIHSLDSKALKNRENFSRWLFELHQLVNKYLDKKSNLTYDEVRDMYENFRSRSLVNDKNLLYKGVKSRTVLHVVPKTSVLESIIINPKSKIKKNKK